MAEQNGTPWIKLYAYVRATVLKSFGQIVTLAQVSGRHAGEGSELPLLPRPSLRRQASSIHSQHTHSRGEEDSPRTPSRPEHSPRALSRADKDSPRALSRAIEDSPRIMSRGEMDLPQIQAKGVESLQTNEEDKETKPMEGEYFKVTTFLTINET